MSSSTKDSDCIRVCVLSSSYEGSQALTKDWDNYVCTPANVLNQDPRYEFTNALILKATAYSQIRALVNSGKFDVFFNMCDGAKDEDRAGITVVQALEEFGVAFTGSDSLHYEPSKLDMKMLAFYAGIKVPPFARVSIRDDVTQVCGHLNFPVIVKHISGYGSVGMRKESKCDNIKELRDEVKRFIDMFGDALVEEFIEGVEINVLAMEELDGNSIRVLQPIQIVFPPGESFKHFDLKWIGMHNHQVSVIVDDPTLSKTCARIGLTAFERILGGVGYGRSDFRVCAKTGEVYLLEINPNCGLFYPNRDGTADLIMDVDPITPAGVARHLIQAALNRNKRLAAKVAPSKVTFHPSKGYHVCATRDISAGDLVFRDESSSFTLVTKSYAQTHWNDVDKLAFAQYAWPLSNEAFVTWNPDPKSWRPINHSCSPNLWFGENHSFNVYARTNIKEGEQLTMDYATFCSGPLMHAFECECEASSCRKKITPLDYSERSELRQVYGTRVTDYIYSKFKKSGELS
uniref:SET domain-containing protein n=1 Tax=Spongospora subterranea TaxID=70186 RepID=A0A0H5RB13_9EUKA|eukprot:CRZ10996.1 hypothetical protein [Spongospora subterranea]